MKATFDGKSDEEDVHLMAQVMGLGPGGVGPAWPGSAPKASAGHLQGNAGCGIRLVAHGPTVLVLEDLHWADPTSLRLTQELSSLAKRAHYCWSLPAGLSPTRA